MISIIAMGKDREGVEDEVIGRRQRRNCPETGRTKPPPLTFIHRLK